MGPSEHRLAISGSEAHPSNMNGRTSFKTTWVAGGKNLYGTRSACLSDAGQGGRGWMIPQAPGGRSSLLIVGGGAFSGARGQNKRERN